MLAGMVNTSNNEINPGEKTVQHMIPHCISHAVTAPAISNSARLSTSELQAWFPLLAPTGFIIMINYVRITLAYHRFGNFRVRKLSYDEFLC